MKKTPVSIIMLMALSVGLTACTHFAADRAPEAQILPAAIAERLRMFYPAYIAWVNGVQQSYAQQGMPLHPQDITWANYLGIVHVDKIHVVHMSSLPMPDQAFLADELRKNGWGEQEKSRSMGYTIFIQPEHDTPANRAKELAMIYQMEQMGYNQFLRRQAQEQRMHLDRAQQDLEVQANRFARCLPDLKGELGVLCHISGIKPKYMPKSLPKLGVQPTQTTVQTPVMPLPAPAYVVPAYIPESISQNSQKKSEKIIGEPSNERIQISAPKTSASNMPIKKVDLNEVGDALGKNERVIKVYEVK